MYVILWLTFVHPSSNTHPQPSGYGTSASWQPEQRGKVVVFLASCYLTKLSLLLQQETCGSEADEFMWIYIGDIPLYS